jgi:hypothetical protein
MKTWRVKMGTNKLYKKFRDLKERKEDIMNKKYDYNSWEKNLAIEDKRVNYYDCWAVSIDIGNKSVNNLGLKKTSVDCMCRNCRQQIFKDMYCYGDIFFVLCLKCMPIVLKKVEEITLKQLKIIKEKDILGDEIRKEIERHNALKMIGGMK